jgi:hypothetical protein
VHASVLTSCAYSHRRGQAVVSVDKSFRVFNNSTKLAEAQRAAGVSLPSGIVDLSFADFLDRLQARLECVLLVAQSPHSEMRWSMLLSWGSPGPIEGLAAGGWQNRDCNCNSDRCVCWHACSTRMRGRHWCTLGRSSTCTFRGSRRTCWRQQSRPRQSPALFTPTL